MRPQNVRLILGPVSYTHLEAIRDFCERIGVSKANSCVDSALLDYCLREDLKTKAKVVMAVLDPVKVVITNYPEGQIDFIAVSYTHLLPFPTLLR